jgi:pimeloyl-ACP methyl ester carboxylesterase
VPPGAAPPLPDDEGFLEDGPQRVHYERHGTGGAETFVLLNGLAMHTKAWYGFLPRLRPEFDVVLYDYPGQGASSDAENPFEIPDLARHLGRILDRLGVGKVHALGMSYGGFVAAEFARLFPARLHTLTLSGILLSHEELFSTYQEVSLAFYAGGEPLFDLYTRYLYEKIFGEAFSARAKEKLPQMRRGFHDRYRGRIDSLVKLTRAQDPFFAALDGNLPGYRAVTAPALVLAGEEDRAISPRAQRKIAELLPNGRYEEIPRAGHVLYLEEPDLFWPRLLRFARSKDPSA